MIDPHTHCRDWNQSYKETLRHALAIAEKAGLSGIFDMPNTDPAIISRELVAKRLAEAYSINSPVFYGLYIGLTSSPSQIREAILTYKEFFPRVVGLKMFAGHSVGNLGIINEDEQRLVYRVLAEEDYCGVLVVHCEKESLLKPALWSPANPKSHSYARPNESEVESVRNQIDFAAEAKFKGRLHIAHISLPESVELVDKAKLEKRIKISCGLTPHHCLLNYELIPESQDGLIYKVNPPLRDKKSAQQMLQLLKLGKIDCIETDHAPHPLKEKLELPYLSGFPGLPFYPHFIKFLITNGFSEHEIKNLTHGNIEAIFGFKIPDLKNPVDFELHKEYEVDVYANLRQ